MFIKKRNAFTMIELVFVIVVVGILAGIAIPKFAATRDDALITRGMATLASVRSAISTERQKRILRGDFTPITDLSSTDGTEYIFTTFNKDQNGTGTPNRVLEYSIKSGTNPGQWSKSGTTYTFHYYGSGTCDYNLTGNRLVGTCTEFGD